MLVPIVLVELSPDFPEELVRVARGRVIDFVTRSTI